MTVEPFPVAASDARAWRGAMLPTTASLREAIANLDATGLQIALVVDERGALLGTVTDGDVRRAILRGTGLEATVDAVMYLTPLVVPPEMGKALVLQLMQANKIRQLPVVDAQRHVVGLHVWDEVSQPNRRDNVVLIMAGGFGRRLLPLTAGCPKPMLPVAGKPLLERVIERARAEGFHRFVISVHYLAHVIESHFGDGSRWGVDIHYLREESPLGTAGALSLLQPAPTQPFVVTNGDVLTELRFAEMIDFHAQHGADATMAVRPHEWRHPFGVVRTDGIAITGFDEKPVHRTHVNAGIYVLDPGVLGHLEPAAVCDMPALFTRLQEAGRSTIAFPMHEPWEDIGRPEDLLRANGTLG
jgi:dTDP-glucose pyrophosphorylase